MHKKDTLHNFFLELLNSANLLSSLKFSKVNFGARDESSDIHVVGNVSMSEPVQALFIWVYVLLTVGERLGPEKK